MFFICSKKSRKMFRIIFRLVSVLRKKWNFFFTFRFRPLERKRKLSRKYLGQWNLCGFSSKLNCYRLDTDTVKFIDSLLFSVWNSKQEKWIFRIASDKKMHEVVVMSDVISRLANSLKVDSIIDLVNFHYWLSCLNSWLNKNLRQKRKSSLFSWLNSWLNKNLRQKRKSSPFCFNYHPNKIQNNCN